MPLGVLSDEQFEQELALSKNENSLRAQVLDIKVGRGNKTETPASLRKLIAEESINGASTKELSQLFNIGKDSITAFKNGATSCATYNKPDPDLKEYVDEKRENIAKTAREKLISALEAITPDKIANAKVQVASQIAKDMSAVIKNIEPNQAVAGPQVQFTFFAPKIRSENDFEVKQIIDHQ